MVGSVTGARGYRVLLVAFVAALAVGLALARPVGASQVAEGDVASFTLDGPGGPRSGDAPFGGDGAAAQDFGIDSFGTYTWSILDAAGALLDSGTIVVDSGAQPCAAAELDEGSSCAGVTHSPLDASPSFITVATRQPVAAGVTTTSAVTSPVGSAPTSAAPTTAATTEGADAGEEDRSSVPWVLVAVAGSGLVLVGLGLRRLFGSSSDDDATPGGGAPATIEKVPPPPSTPEEKPPVCRIEVQANEINGLGIYHLCLIFHDRHGARYFRGGPGETTWKDGFLGRVTATTGKHVPGAVDWEPGCATVLIAEGPEVCAKKDLLYAELQRINRMAAGYELEGPNSNTTVRRLLRAAGVPQEKPNVLTPGWDHDGLDPKPPKPSGPGPVPAPAPVPIPPSTPPGGSGR